MSRIGKQPIEIPSGVEVTIDGLNVKVKGKNGEDSLKISESVALEQNENELVLTIPENYTKQQNIDHGLYRSLIYNMVVGVSEGYQKTLQIEGTGDRKSVV